MWNDWGQVQILGPEKTSTAGNLIILLLLCDCLIIHIPVLELKYILETLHVPAEMQHNQKNVAQICKHIPIIALHACIRTDQLCTRCTEGVLSRLSGNKSISFKIFASLTGSSCLRNVNDVFSQAFSEPEEKNVYRETENYENIIIIWWFHHLIDKGVTEYRIPRVMGTWGSNKLNEGPRKPLSNAM